MKKKVVVWLLLVSVAIGCALFIKSASNKSYLILKNGEFIDIIEWTDDSNDTLVWRFERYQNEIKNGAKLTVRQQQVAIFVNEGQIADIFTYDCSFVFNTSKPEGAARKLLDSSLAHQFGWSPKLSIKESIELVIQSYLQNQAA